MTIVQTADIERRGSRFWRDSVWRLQCIRTWVYQRVLGRETRWRL